MTPPLGESLQAGFEWLFSERELMDRLGELGDLRIAVIGFGKMGLLHSTILNMLLGDGVRAVVDRSLIVRLGMSRVFRGVEFYRDIRDALSRGIDLVYITTPTPSHYSLLKLLLPDRSIRGVFVEKPPTVTYGQLMDVAGMGGGKTTMVGLQKRYSMPFRHAKALLDDGVLRGIESAESYIKSGDVLERTGRFDSIGRGVLLDMGIHLADVLSWFFGELRVEDAECTSIYTGVDDYCRVRLVSSDGFSVRLEATWSDPAYRIPESMVRVYGSRGVLEVTEDYLKLSTSGGERVFYKPHYYQGIPPVLVADPEYTIENMHLLLSILEGREPMTSIGSAVPAMRLIEEAYSKANRYG